VSGSMGNKYITALIIGIVLVMQIFMCVLLFFDRVQIATEKTLLQKQVYDLQKEAKEMQRSERYCVKTSARYL
jgi:hypothetical protein